MSNTALDPFNGYWRCTNCNEFHQIDQESRWRWNSKAYEHRCTGSSVEAGYSLAKLIDPIEEITRLETLLEAYRIKRAVDGSNTRPWYANVHYYADEAVTALETQPIICKTGDWETLLLRAQELITKRK